MWYTGSMRSADPFVVEVLVQNRPLRMELDTGASVSVIGEKLFREKFPGIKLKDSSVFLISYSGQVSSVKAEVTLNVRFRNNDCRLPLFVMAGETPALFGA